MLQKEQAARFRGLHARGECLILANAWDAASARIVEELGGQAIATSSAAVAWANGYSDGQALPKERLLSLVSDIVRVSTLPVSADSEAGYAAAADEVAAFVVTLAKAGAVGINIEDGKESPDLLVAKIRAIKTACDREGLDVFVNARTDVYLKSLVPAERALEETLTRGRLYHDAGADGFFVPWMSELEEIRRVCATISLPVNALTFRDLPPLDALKAAGVRRLSSGAGPARAAYGETVRSMRQLLNEGRFDEMTASGADCPNLNALLS